MQNETLGKLLPKLLLPYAQQWAERSGMPLLSKLLVDEHLRALVERYGEELLERVSAAQRAQVWDGEPAGAGKPVLRVIRNDEEPAQHDADVSDLEARLEAIESQYELLLGMLEAVRTKMKPLAAALGCCPDCMVGVAGCFRCLGKSRVGYYEPDRSLLQAEVVGPLAVRGLPLTFDEAPPRPARQANEEPTRARTKQWPRK